MHVGGDKYVFRIKRGCPPMYRYLYGLTIYKRVEKRRLHSIAFELVNNHDIPGVVTVEVKT